MIVCFVCIQCASETCELKTGSFDMKIQKVVNKYIEAYTYTYNPYFHVKRASS